MEIIKMGDPKRITWIGECDNCKAILKASANEVTISDYLDTREDVAHALCVECTETVRFRREYSRSSKRILEKV